MTTVAIELYHAPGLAESLRGTLRTNLKHFGGQAVHRRDGRVSLTVVPTISYEATHLFICAHSNGRLGHRDAAKRIAEIVADTLRNARAADPSVPDALTLESHVSFHGRTPSVHECRIEA